MIKNYNQLSSNYLNNKLIIPDYSSKLLELFNDLEIIRYRIPNETFQLMPELYNLPLIKNFSGFNKIKISEDFSQTNILKGEIPESLKTIRNFLKSITFDKLYYYSNFNWYVSRYDNKLSGISAVSGNVDYENLQHPLINIVLANILPQLLTNTINNYKNDITKIFKTQKYNNLSNDFSLFIELNKNEISKKITTFISSQLIVLSPYYKSSNLTDNINSIITHEFIDKFPKFSFNFNKQLVITNIYKHQLNQLVLDNINTNGLTNINLDNELKEFNNKIANDILVINKDLNVHLYVILGDYKHNQQFLINAFYIAYNLAINEFKNKFSDNLLPLNFSQDIFNKTIQNLDLSKLNINNFKDNQVFIIKNSIIQFFISVIDVYFNNLEVEEILLNILNKLSIYNNNAVAFFNPLQQYIKLLFLKYIINGILFKQLTDDFIKIYTSTNIIDTVDINLKEKLQNIKFNQSYYDEEIFNFMFNSVYFNIVNSMIKKYAF